MRFSLSVLGHWILFASVEFTVTLSGCAFRSVACAILGCLTVRLRSYTLYRAMAAAVTVDELRNIAIRLEHAAACVTARVSNLASVTPRLQASVNTCTRAVGDAFARINASIGSAWHGGVQGLAPRRSLLQQQQRQLLKMCSVVRSTAGVTASQYTAIAALIDEATHVDSSSDAVLAAAVTSRLVKPRVAPLPAVGALRGPMVNTVSLKPVALTIHVGGSLSRFTPLGWSCMPV